MPYQVPKEIKQDLVKQWKLSDKVFFSCGACQILAQVYLDKFPNSGFRAEWIKPNEGFSGNHVYVTDGSLVFDWHGYSKKKNFLRHYFKRWRLHYSKVGEESQNWNAKVVPIFTNLTDSEANLSIGMNARGADRYLLDPIPRAKAYLDRFAKQHQELHNNQKVANL